MAATCIFTNTETAVVQDARVLSMSATLHGSGQRGQASVFVPRTSLAHDPRFIDEQGGSFVDIQHPDFGIWNGYVDGPKLKVDSLGVTLPLMELSGLTANEAVQGGTFTGLTAGRLALIAWGQANAAPLSKVVSIGAVYDGPPVFDYTMAADPLEKVLDDLAAKSGQTWRIKDKRLVWGPGAMRLYPEPLITDGDLFGESLSVDTSGLTRAVTVTGTDGQSYTAWAPEHARRAGSVRERVTVESTSYEYIRQQANALLNQKRYARTVISGAVTGRLATSTTITVPTANLPGTHPLARRLGQAESVTGVVTTVRPFVEGDRVLVITRHAALTPRTVLCRVVSRSWSEGSSTVNVDLQAIRPLVITDLTDGGLLPATPILAPSIKGNLYQLLKSAQALVTS